MFPNRADENSNSHASGQLCLRAISEKFERLNRIKEICSKDFGLEVYGINTAGQSNEMLERFVDPIDDELVQLGWLATDSVAKDQQSIQLKAEILHTLLEHDPNDLVSSLVRSLIRDLRAS